MLWAIAAIGVPALSTTPVSSVSGSDPPPGEEHSKSTNDRVDGRDHLVKSRHLDLEPIDQTRNDERDDPGGDERRESPAEECSPYPGLRPLGYCHALMYRVVELLSERKVAGRLVSPATSKKLVVVPYISHVTPAVPAIRHEIAAVTAKIASVAPQLFLVAIPDVISNLSLVTSQLAAVALNLSRILSKLATIYPCSIVVSTPADDRVTGGGNLRGGIGSSDHQGPSKGGGSCAQFQHLNSPVSFCATARVCTVSTR